MAGEYTAKIRKAIGRISIDGIQPPANTLNSRRENHEPSKNDPAIPEGEKGL
jgi:hypothetical protein